MLVIMILGLAGLAMLWSAVPREWKEIAKGLLIAWVMACAIFAVIAETWMRGGRLPFSW